MTRARRAPLALRLAALATSCALVVACSAGPDDRGADADGGTASTSDREERDRASDAGAADEATSWGPTRGEVTRAEQLVAAMTPDELVGQVIVGRYLGTDPAEPARMVADLHLAGVAVTGGNVADDAQVRATTSAIAEAAADRDYPPIIGVDQEGGSVSHLGEVGTDFPAFAAAGEAIEADDARSGSGSQGRAAVRSAARATGLELRDLGFGWVFAPVADVTVGDADPTIGSRSPSSDPAVAASAAASAVTGYHAAAVVSTTKHFPGHGTATADSHDELPVLESTLDELAERDLVPFRRAVERGAPAVMMAHLDVPALDPGVPTSLSPAAYELLREEVGFEGVAVTDSLGMGAVAGEDRPAVAALAAGADLLLMPVDTRTTHGVVLDALRTGELDRDRLEEAASRVVALQLWQERWAGDRPVPENVAARTARAAAALTAAAAR